MSDSTEILIESPHQTETIASLVRKMLVLLGEDPNREGLRKTPGALRAGAAFSH